MADPMPHCLEHHRIADQATPWGMVCPDCKRRLYTAEVEPRRFWLSQPEAYTLDGRPRFVSVIRLGDEQLRTLATPEPAPSPATEPND